METAALADVQKKSALLSPPFALPSGSHLSLFRTASLLGGYSIGIGTLNSQLPGQR